MGGSSLLTFSMRRPSPSLRKQWLAGGIPDRRFASEKEQSAYTGTETRCPSCLATAANRSS